MGSTRFPGKVLAPLGGHLVLDWVLRRVTRASRIDRVILATSVNPENDGLVPVAEAAGVTVLRGDEHDVLSRFASAARSSGATWVVRICADNPFVDPDEVDRLVSFAVTEQPDYAFNHLNRLDNGYADGFGAEAITAQALLALDAGPTGATEREHLTLAVWQHPGRYRIRTFAAPAALAYPHLRFDIDTPADLERLAFLADLGLSAPAEAFVRAALALETATGTPV